MFTKKRKKLMFSWTIYPTPENFTQLLLGFLWHLERLLSAWPPWDWEVVALEVTSPLEPQKLILTPLVVHCFTRLVVHCSTPLVVHCSTPLVVHCCTPISGLMDAILGKGIPPPSFILVWWPFFFKSSPFFKSSFYDWGVND